MTVNCKCDACGKMNNINDLTAFRNEHLDGMVCRDCGTFFGILRFMQDNDRNGDWLTADKHEAPYIRRVLIDWIETSGLEVTPRVQGYLDYLEGVEA